MKNTKEYAQQHRKANKSMYNEAQKKYQSKVLNTERFKAKQQRWRTKLKSIVFEAYGNKCACCGETEPKFLEIDHVNNDGATDHRRLERLLVWIKKNNFPSDYQILCSNCNHGRYRNGGICPHKTQK